MIRQIRSEIRKLTTTRTAVSVGAALIVLAAAAVALHAVGLGTDRLDSAADQRGVLADVSINLGGLFAALLGALAFTTEARTGTLRPTFLTSPNRARVMAAKAVTTALVGAVTAGLGAVAATVVGAIAFNARAGISFHVGAGDITRLVGGALVAGALLALLGLAVGALVRAQIPAVVGLFAWLLFVENLLMDVSGVHRFVPGALAQAVAGQSHDGILTSGWAAGGLLTAYAVVALAAGTTAVARRDVP